MSDKYDSTVVGWREWVSLPSLGITVIKAKIDTGARTSALHAFSISPFEKNNALWVRFATLPNQHDSDTVIWCESEVLDKRKVTDSGGHEELRYVIKTDITLGQEIWPIEVTLTNRDTMLFRMLLGRTAMIPGNIIVNPALSYLVGKGVIEHKQELEQEAF